MYVFDSLKGMLKMSLLNDNCPITKQIDNIDETIKELNSRLGKLFWLEEDGGEQVKKIINLRKTREKAGGIKSTSWKFGKESHNTRTSRDKKAC